MKHWKLIMVINMSENKSLEKNNPGRKRIYSDDTIMKLLMVMIMNQIPTFKGLHRYLEQNPSILSNCGLDSLPSRRTLGRRMKRFMPLWVRKEPIKREKHENR